MTNDEIEAVRAELEGCLEPESPQDWTCARALAAIDHLLARAEQAETECDQARAGAEIWKDRAEQAERERDGCKIMAEGFKAQLSARDAAIAESLRRANNYDFEKDYHGMHAAIKVAEPLRQFQQPEGDKLVASVGMALCETALGGKRCPCRDKGSFSCEKEHPGNMARAAIAEIAARGGRVVFDGEGK